MSNRKNISLLALCFILLSHNLYSQILLQGTVTDNGGEYLRSGAEPVVNALVTLTDQTNTTRWFSAYTDEQGHYTIKILAIGIADNPSETPGDFQLMQNYPNPLNATTTIRYDIPTQSHVSLRIYDTLGRLVTELVNAEGRAAGAHAVVWDGTNFDGTVVPSGLYVYALQTEKSRVVKKMVVLE
ncbi:T9SS type A sorting domain-containing protein [candidate division KSB1 bacterium]|nr:T9SS type A sorting domain-containing protein [candidate division KSB1 bacterium]